MGNVKKAKGYPLSTCAYNTLDVAVDTGFRKGNNRNAYPACFKASFEPHALCDDFQCCGSFVGECPMPVWCAVCLTLRSFAAGSDACRRRNRSSGRLEPPRARVSKFKSQPPQSLLAVCSHSPSFEVACPGMHPLDFPSAVGLERHKLCDKCGHRDYLGRSIHTAYPKYTFAWPPTHCQGWRCNVRVRQY